MRPKLFIGPKVRSLREARGWRLETCARRLGVSISYLSQIEANQRPVTSRVLMALVETFDAPASAFDADDDQRLIADLREAIADAGLGGSPPPLSELRAAAIHAPSLARLYLDLHRAYHRLDERLKTTEEAVALDEMGAASAQLPYEEVRDFFHYTDNYLHALDAAAEALAGRVGLPTASALDRVLESYLAEAFGVRVAYVAEEELLHRFEPGSGVLALNAAHPPETRAFQMAYHLAARELSPLIEAELAAAGLKSAAAAAICRISLTNYAAGALVMPYEQFRSAAQALRHDIDALALRFQSSIEQTCHRLSTLQRPGARGIPFYFVRIDLAGNITKRHSATRFQFARFGGACPLWNVHEAFGHDGKTLVQLAEMPDGVRYLCMAWSVQKRSGSHQAPPRRYALGLGCEARYSDALIYSDGLDLKGPATPIGVSCRICERDACPQRAFPPVDRGFRVPRHERAVVPFSLTPEA
jgi:XRE family transcriptional regulator, fatty acid utilization regulator